VDSAKNTDTPERRFLFKLAPHLGMTVSQLERMPYRELVEWMEEYRRDPWGTWRDNTHAAMICTLIGNAFRGKEGRPFSVEDFMLLDAETAEQKRAERRAKYGKSLVDALNSMAKVH
jgi:hypothetical protein